MRYGLVCGNSTLYSCAGTLMTAKKRGVVAYDGQLLLQGVHNNVEICLLKTEIPDTALPDHTKVSQSCTCFTCAIEPDMHLTVRIVC